MKKICCFYCDKCDKKLIGSLHRGLARHTLQISFTTIL